MSETILAQTPSANGHGPNTAITYSRVSGDHQRDHGYSLDDQRRALRQWCQENGYTILEEVEDGAWSGGDLMRPGLDRVKELVKAGGVDAVVVLFRDRLARGVYAQLLVEEFAEHGCKLIALNAQLDNSPEGELQGGILDVISAWERKKIAERTQRGRLEKARKGFVVAARAPAYGYRFTEDRNHYQVDELAMSAIRRIFELVADGTPLNSVPKILAAEHYPPPEGGIRWGRPFVRKAIKDDVYRPHDRADLDALVAEGLLDREVAQNAPTPCGIWWFNRARRVTYKEPDGNGGYRKRSHTTERPRSEWIAVPVPWSGTPAKEVEAARVAIKDNHVPSRAGGRFAELSGGILYCGGCGKRMQHYTTRAGKQKRLYSYYKCPTVASYGRAACPAKKTTVRADKLDEKVWAMLSDARALREDLIRTTFDGYDEWLRRLASDLSAQTRLSERLEKIEARRSNLIDMGADGTITRDDLKGKLSELDHERQAIRQEMVQAAGAKELRTRLLAQRNWLLERTEGGFLEHLTSEGPEDRHALYKKMGLRVELDDAGNPILYGAFDLFSETDSISR